MITDINFKKNVGQRFWRHIHKETLIPYRGKTPSRILFLEKLCNDVENMKYVPSSPRGYVVSHKQNLVVRFIPALKREDLCVYFFCLKCLEKEIAKNRVKGTYGGWKLGGKIRKMENLDVVPSFPDYSYNRFAWMQAWTDYQNRAFNLQRNSKYNFFIVYDIANFYDSIRLGRLEILIREVVKRNKTEVVNLLIYFLSNWGKRDLNYNRQNIGLPQDEVGDCSRILANFYMQDYDKTVFSKCKRRSSGYLRFADDQIIASPDEKTAKEIMFLASKELAKIGLNLNANKAKLLKKSEFYDYWSFDIFKLLANKNDRVSIEKAWKLFEQKITRKEQFKPESVLKRILSCNLNKVSLKIRKEILTAVKEKDFITSINEYYLKRIYIFLRSKERILFLKYLNKLSKDVLFNRYHLCVMKFARECSVSKMYLNKLKPNLSKLNDMNQ